MESSRETQLAQLLAFAGGLLASAAEGFDFDGSDLQEAAITYGLVQPTRKEAPCGEVCPCADAVGAGETECMVYTDLGQAAVQAFRNYTTPTTPAAPVAPPDGEAVTRFLAWDYTNGCDSDVCRPDGVCDGCKTIMAVQRQLRTMLATHREEDSQPRGMRDEHWHPSKGPCTVCATPAAPPRALAAERRFERRSLLASLTPEQLAGAVQPQLTDVSGVAPPDDGAALREAVEQAEVLLRGAAQEQERGGPFNFQYFTAQHTQAWRILDAARQRDPRATPTAEEVEYTLDHLDWFTDAPGAGEGGSENG